VISELNKLFRRTTSLFRQRSKDREITEELEFHQHLLREKLVRQGVPQSQVDATMRRTFGNPNRWRERLRELWQFRTLENFLRDLAFSFRLLRKSPGFTSIALITLALGVGANTGVFSLINGLLLRPLPVPNAHQLAVLRMDEGGPQPDYSFITPFFRSLESRHDLFTNVFAYNSDLLQVKGTSGNENIPGVLVSGQYFEALQTSPLLGRYLTPADDQHGGSSSGFAVVISESFWDRWFHRSPEAVGSKLVIANVPFTVVGVMPHSFIGADPTQRPEIYAPLSADPIIDAPRNHIDAGIHAWWLTVVARMPSGMTLDQANAALLTVSSPILHEASSDPQFITDEEKSHFHFSAESGSRGFTEARISFRKPLITMFCMCAGILLLACLNLASLLMARSAARERELVTRLALGASRRRLVHQLLVESLLVATLGTALGMLAAPMVSHSLSTMLAPSSIQERGQRVELDTSIDLRVLLFAAAIAITASILIGLIPALQATGGDLNEHIKEGQHPTKAHERRKPLPRILMASQVALALILVTGAALLATSLIRLYQSGAGFDPRGVVNIAFDMDQQQLDGDRLMQVYQQIGDQLRRQPGVKSASFQFIVPLSHRGWNGFVSAPGGERHLLYFNSVGPDYFSTMRIPMFQGREFQWTDTAASGLKMILNQSAAKQLFPNRSPLGQHVINPESHKAYEVVAVVADAKYRDMRKPAPAAAYVPMQQDEREKPSFSALVRLDPANASLAPIASASRAIAARLAPAIPPPTITTLSEVMDSALGTERVMATLSIFFAACALLVTAIGLYGTLAYATARRTSEIGIRVALGAQRASVVVLIFRENATVAIAGCAAGLAIAAIASKALASFLYETSPRDPWIFFGSVAVLSIIASAASLLPALRAARIEPITAIRCE
jgi:predicted permease